MRKFMTLVYLEVNRMAKLFFMALAAYFAISCVWVFFTARGYMQSITMSAASGHMSIKEYLKSCGAVPYQGKDIISGNYGLAAGAVFLMILVVLYAFIIWYRDWFGSNKTIYAILILPIDRMKVYAAKAVTIILMGCSVISTFLIGLMASFYIDKAVIDEFIISDVTLLDTFSYVIDTTIYKKTDSILFAIAVLCVIFLFVLLERSFKLKGIILGVIIFALYSIISIYILSSRYFYAGEKILVFGTAQTVFIGLSIFYSNYLIKKKVAV